MLYNWVDVRTQLISASKGDFERIVLEQKKRKKILLEYKNVINRQLRHHTQSE